MKTKVKNNKKRDGVFCHDWKIVALVIIGLILVFYGINNPNSTFVESINNFAKSGIFIFIGIGG